jgi:hypothetical protein
MFYIPFLLGILVGGRFNGAVLVLLVAASALFISRESLLIVWRSRGRGQVNAAAVRLLSIYLGLALGGGLLLLLHYRLAALLWLGLPGLGLLLLNGRQAAQREDRTIPSEILAICGMTLSAPAAHYAATGYWTATTWWLWLFSILYFTSSVFYVRYRVTSLHGRDPELKKKVTRLSLLYHLLLPTILVMIIVTAEWSLLLLAAFLPIIGRALFHHLRPPAGLDLRRIGLSEIAYAVIFLILTVAALS